MQKPGREKCRNYGFRSSAVPRLDASPMINPSCLDIPRQHACNGVPQTVLRPAWPGSDTRHPVMSTRQDQLRTLTLENLTHDRIGHS
jgi:hypothetical protein